MSKYIVTWKIPQGGLGSLIFNNLDEACEFFAFINATFVAKIVEV